MNPALRAYADTAYAVAVLAYFNPTAAARPADWLRERLPLKQAGTDAGPRAGNQRVPRGAARSGILLA